jgi:multiple sugar transport system substrate-binding protein
MFTAAPDVQRGIYFAAGGQPGHRSAWVDPAVNAACHGFFQDTLPTLDEAICRPKVPGYMDFQDAAAPVAHAAVAGRTSVTDAAREMAKLWEKIR